MNHYEVLIALMLAAQLFTVFLLWRCNAEREWFRMAWIRESRELLDLKREREL